METYTILRHFADSWALLALVIFFVGVIAWAFRPGSRRVHDEAKTVIFRNDAPPDETREPAGRADDDEDRT